MFDEGLDSMNSACASWSARCGPVEHWPRPRSVHKNHNSVIWNLNCHAELYVASAEGAAVAEHGGEAFRVCSTACAVEKSLLAH